jgi:biotin synthase
MTEIRHDWTKEEISDIYHSPLLDLIYRAASIHRQNKDYAEVQVSSLLSIKTGGCSEDCSYCPQAARYNTGVEVHALMSLEQVTSAAQKAKDGGVYGRGLARSSRQSRF